ncbi:MAG: outer membrane protein assembly factor BamB [Proteobacteria bacterium]|nr:outer membrane protein assembly factor BamB [Pseudomonadota bacterium]
MNRLRPGFVAVLASLSLAACSTWNPFVSGDGKLPALKPLSNPVRTAEVWRASVGDSGSFVLQPALSGDVVFAAGRDGKVVKLQGGKTVWKTDVGVTVSGGVGSDGQLVLVASPKGDVIALDGATGQVRWKAKVNAEVLAAPAVSDSIVVVRSADSRLFGLEPSTGKQRWVYQRATPALALRSSAGVVLDDKLILAGFPGGKLAAVNVANGSLMWEGTVAIPRGATELERVADITSLPVMSARATCAVAYQGRVACFDMSNGSTLWTRDLSSSRGLDLDDRHVFVTDEKGAVHALDVTNGASAWKQDQLVGRSPGRPRVVGAYVIVGDGFGDVHVLRREDGALVGRARVVSSAIAADLQRAGGEVVVQTQNGTIYALGVQ